MKPLLQGRSIARWCGPLLIAAMCGCAGLGRMAPRREAPPAAPRVTERQALRIAERATRAKNPGVREIRSRAVFTDGRWLVSVNYAVDFDPLGLLTTEEHCTVLLDPSGRVIGYRPGPSPR